MQYYHGVIYFKDGRIQTTGSCNDRRQAERLAQQVFEQAMRTAINDFFKPTRYEVIED